MTYLGPQSEERTSTAWKSTAFPLPEVIRMAQRGELLQAMQISTLFFALSHLGRITP